jgi:hypothetical protein
METAVVPECVEAEPETKRSSVEKSDLSSMRPPSERGVERFDPLGTVSRTSAIGTKSTLRRPHRGVWPWRCA